jgi:hypothetical protein
MTIAEHMYYEVPVVCSSFLKYAKKEIQEILVEDPNNCYEIYSKIKYLVDNPKAIIDLGKQCSEIIKTVNYKNKERVYSFLNGVINNA